MDKQKQLSRMLKGLKSAVVAYSGGLDSTFLLKAAVDALGNANVLAVTARSETYPVSEYRYAVRLAKRIGARHLTVKTRELGIKNFRDNPVNRCYYCKRELFRKLDAIRRRHKMGAVLDGTNYDDLKDVRYGRFAAKELKVRSPLLAAKITKDDIRRFSKRMGLETWDKPSFACLASRVPFNSAITAADLRRIGEAEDCLRRLGFRQVRVRAHDKIARIELSPGDLRKAVSLKERIADGLKKAGFVYAALDLAGYRTGSMHEVLTKTGRKYNI